METVAELQKKKVTELFRVAFRDDEDGSVEIYFFDVYLDRSHKNLLFTSTYFNPVATDNLLVKLMSTADAYEFLESVGFIGKIANDNHSNVERCIDRAFKMFLKHLGFEFNQGKEVDDIDRLKPGEVFEKFFCDKIEKSAPLAPEPVQTSRYTFRDRFKKPTFAEKKSALVDLTAQQDQEDEICEGLAPSEIFYACCSDLTGIDQPTDVQPCLGFELCEENCERNKLIWQSCNFDRIEPWLMENDFLDYPDNYADDHPEDLRTLSQMLKDFETVKEKAKSDPNQLYSWEKSEQKNATCYREESLLQQENERSSDQPSTSKHFSQTKAFQHYNQKSAKDRGVESSSIVRGSDFFASLPEIGKGLDKKKPVVLDAPKRNRLLDDEDYKHISKELTKSKKIILQSSAPESQPLLQGYKIPKIEKGSQSSENKASSSVIEKSPPPHDRIMSRPSIHSHKKYFPNRGERILAKLKFPDPSTASPESGYDPRSLATKPHPSFYSQSVSNRLGRRDDDQEDDDDVIMVETEDLNNNGKSGKRTLFNPEPLNKFSKSRNQKNHP